MAIRKEQKNTDYSHALQALSLTTADVQVYMRVNGLSHDEAVKELVSFKGKIGKPIRELMHCQIGFTRKEAAGIYYRTSGLIKKR